MEYERIILKLDGKQTIAQLIIKNEQDNSITKQLLQELEKALDIIEQLEYRIVTIEGNSGIFCNGLSMKNMAEGNLEGQITAKKFQNILTRFRTSSAVIIAKVNGTVRAGGVGIVAACDFAVAYENIEVSLTEVLWGLIPAVITPFLIQKVGYFNAYQMSLLAKPYSAQQGLEIHLFDAVGNDLDREVNTLCQRIKLLEPETIQCLKNYYKELNYFGEQVNQFAIQTILELTEKSNIKENVENFIKYRRFPWEKEFK